MIGYNYKRILILGDAGRGKSTFAEKLSQKTRIPHHSTDDFFWKVKFTEANNREESVKKVSEIYQQDKWIIEGTTRRLILEGLEKADIIYFLQFKNIIHQYYFLTKRSLTRKNEGIIGWWDLLKHVTNKRYKKGYGGYHIPLHKLLQPHKNKVMELNSMKEINKCLEDIKIKP